jgi:NAD(P)H-hydrate epimerase
VIVDALLGTGAQYAEAIRAINACQRPVFALDLPSGLDGDSGAALGAAVRADCTITFVAPKMGLYLGDGPEYSGRVLCDDLEVERLRGPEYRPPLERLRETDIATALPRRRRSAHKGEFGRVLIIGSGAGMPGAVRLAGEACLRVGAGLVTTATAPENVAAIAAGRPELICLGLQSAADLAAPLAAADLVALGPGLGRGPWAQAVFEAVLRCGKPLVLDADALNLLAETGRRPPPRSILTPHPGEAGRLLACTSGDVQSDRFGALRRLLERTGSIVVLKGAGTLLGAAGEISALCERGNPGMASPGMGDVLTGAIAGILAQCDNPWLAAKAAVLVHALAGDELAHNTGERGLLALELAEGLTHWVNGPA